MNWAHIHLMFNHLPVIGSWFGAAFLLVAVVRRNDTLFNSGLVILLFSALVAIIVDISGDHAIPYVRTQPGVTRAYIHEHEEAAEFAFTIAEIVGAVALVGLVLRLRRKVLPVWFRWGMLVLALFVSVIMLRTANLGGQIRHTEIRGADSLASPAVPPPPEGAHE